MVAVVWQLTIHEDTTEQFERFYGADGEWTQLSRKSRSFLGSSFLRDLAMPTRYLLVEYWSEMLVYEKHIADFDRKSRRSRNDARNSRPASNRSACSRRSTCRRASGPPGPAGRADDDEMRTAPAIRSPAVAAACLLLTLTLSARTTGRAQQASASSPPLSFNRDIRPILSNNCFACHGPDEKQREPSSASTRATRMFLEEGVIVPGSAAKSLLVEKINEPNPEDRMPPPDSGHALTDKQKALLTRWIDEGAKWDSHWAFTAAGPHRTAGSESRRAGCATRSTIHPGPPRA